MTPQPHTLCTCSRPRFDHPTATCADFHAPGSRPRRSGPRSALLANRKPSAALLRELIEANAALLDAETLAELADRPRTRGDCADGPRPCPWASCRHSLMLDVTPAGSIKLLHPDGGAAESCALDVADRGEHTLDVVGQLLNVTRERTRQIEIVALRRLRRAREP